MSTNRIQTQLHDRDCNLLSLQHSKSFSCSGIVALITNIVL